MKIPPNGLLLATISLAAFFAAGEVTNAARARA